MPFKLTKQSFKDLKTNDIPESIVKDLATLKNQAFQTKEEFLDAVRRNINTEQSKMYEILVLEYARTQLTKQDRTGEKVKQCKSYKEIIFQYALQTDFDAIVERRRKQITQRVKNLVDFNTDFDACRLFERVKHDIVEYVKEVEESFKTDRSNKANMWS